MLLTPLPEIEARAARLQARLRAAELDAALLLQAADQYYFSGTVQSAWLIVPADGAPLLLVRRDLGRARAESPLARIAGMGQPREVPGLLRAHGLGGLRRVGLEFDVLPVEQYVRIGRLFPTVQLVDASRLVREVRMVKSAWEVAIMRRGAALQDRLAQRLAEILRPGVSDMELAAEVEAEARRRGHQGPIRMRRFNAECFYGHLLVGEDGAVPSWIESPSGGPGLSPAFNNGPSGRRVRAHEPVLLDYAAALDGYHSDQTRTFSVGALPAEAARAYDACRTIWETLRERLRPGETAAAVYEAARAQADRLGYADRFMNAGPAQVPFVGHGVGVELDELPVLGRGSDLRLEPGMTLAIEPKIVCPGLGMVGLEDTLLVTEGGPEVLTVTPRDIWVV
ncbi:MAG: M24 family metallopeptidase [Candidatus Methylomirabilales bacterium]